MGRKPRTERQWIGLEARTDAPPPTQADLLRRDLNRIAERTKNAVGLKPSGGFVGNGDSAEERRVLDDLNAGRFAWRAAHSASLTGLAFLDEGNTDEADACLREATWQMFEAYDTIIERKQIARLGASAKPAGPKPKDADLVRRLSEAMAAQRELKGPAALASALRADPSLKAECEADPRSDAALLSAVWRLRERDGG